MAEKYDELEALFAQLSNGELTDAELEAEVDALNGPSKSTKASKSTRTYADDYFTEESLGALFADHIRDELIAVEEWKGWAERDPESGRWSKVPNSRVNTRAAEWLKDVYEDAKANGSETDAKAALRFRSVVPRQHVVEAATGRVVVSSSEFDNHPDLFLASNGVVDLPTGDLRPAEASDMFTKHTEVDYVPGATHEGWDAILSAFPDDVLPYLQVAVGQALTGYQPHPAAVHFLHGAGGNGKSAFIDVLDQVAGEYSKRPVAQVLLQSQNSSDSNLMVFKGLRLALFEELPDNRFLDSFTVKRLSGTRTLRAAQKYQVEEEFPIIASNFINTNHLPRVAEMEWSTWRRLRLIPMPYQFMPADECSEPHHRPARADLEDLKHDSGVLRAALAWAVEGAIAWYERGKTLPAPTASMTAAMEAWRDDNDKIGAWWDETVEASEGWFCLVQDLYDSYAAHLKAQGLKTEALRTFMTALRDHELFKAANAEHRAKARHTDLKQSQYETSEFEQPRKAGAQATFIKGIKFKR